MVLLVTRTGSVARSARRTGQVESGPPTRSQLDRRKYDVAVRAVGSRTGAIDSPGATLSIFRSGRIGQQYEESPLIATSRSADDVAPASRAAPILIAEALRYAYRGVPAVTEISFSMDRGSITALIGANGSGKTTSVKMIAGALRPDGGRILLDGEDIAGTPAHKVVERGITLVPEGRLVFPAMTVTENLQIGGTAQRAAANLAINMERVFDLFPRLAERRDQLAGTMSGGEQQMMVIGRALMAKPRLLLLDEPSLGIAPKLVQDIARSIVAINRDEKVSVLLVEQTVNQALAIAQHAHVLEKGRVVKSGSGSALLHDPAVREAFLGGL